jgi:hypothetical protein
MESKERKTTAWNTTVIVAVITLCGTITSAVLGSPAIAELVRGQKGTPTPSLALTQGPGATTPTPAYTATPLLPDLAPVAISAPTCITDHTPGATRTKYVRQVVTIRNLGPGGTASFGSFSSRVILTAGGQRYPLEDWASLYNGVVGPLDLNTASLGPNDDADLVLNIDLRGYSRYSLEVITNSGAAVIPEVNSANNSLSRDFSTNCK